MPPTADAAAAGAIYDIGYRRYEGARLGRGYAFRTLFTHSLRAAFGIHRGGRALVVPWALFVLITLPAVAQVIVGALSGGEARIVGYHDYVWPVSMLLVLFCAGQAPEVVSTDQRHQVLPLYFSRALRRTDYALATLTAMVVAVFLLTIVPLLVLLAGRVASAESFRAIARAEAPNLLPIVGSSLFVALALGSVSLAVASLTGRRAHATAGMVGFMMITAAVAQTLWENAGGDLKRYALLLNPIIPLLGGVHALFGVVPEASTMTARAALPAWLHLTVPMALAAASVALLLTRYRRIRT